MLLPLFEYISEPEKIDFDDDILLVIKSLIRKKKGVTPTIWRMLPCFQLILNKNKHCFGHLMEVLNIMMMEGRETLAENQEGLQLILGLAHTAMFSQENGSAKTMSTKVSNNAEGTVLLQLIL